MTGNGESERKLLQDNNAPLCPHNSMDNTGCPWLLHHSTLGVHGCCTTAHWVSMAAAPQHTGCPWLLHHSTTLGVHGCCTTAPHWVSMAVAPQDTGCPWLLHHSTLGVHGCCTTAHWVSMAVAPQHTGCQGIGSQYS